MQNGKLIAKVERVYYLCLLLLYIQFEMFQVSGIIGKRKRNGKMEYHVSWEGFPISQSTWQPVRNLTQIQDLIQNFEKNQKQNTPKNKFPSHKDIKILQISQNDNNKLTYQINQKGIIKVVTRNYLIQNNMLLPLCQFYQSKLQLIEDKSADSFQELESYVIYDMENEEEEENNFCYEDFVYKRNEMQEELQEEQQDKQSEQLQEKQDNKNVRFVLGRHKQNQEILKEVIKLTQEDLTNFFNYSDDTVKNIQEDEQLMKAKKKGMSYEQIARLFNKGTKEYWKRRYTTLIKKQKNLWSRSEDKLLKKLVAQYGKNWRHIHSIFVTRPNVEVIRGVTEIRDHYAQMKYQKEDWTLQMDLTLLGLFRKYGKSWDILRKEMKIARYRVLGRYNRFVECWRYKKQKQEQKNG